MELLQHGISASPIHKPNIDIFDLGKEHGHGYPIAHRSCADVFRIEIDWWSCDIERCSQVHDDISDTNQIPKYVVLVPCDQCVASLDILLEVFNNVLDIF